jgi:hypothetical protein
MAEQILARLHMADALHERGEELELSRRELELPPGQAGFVGGQVHDQFTDMELGARLADGPRAVNHVPHAQGEFARLERERKEIIRAEFEREQAVSLVALAAEDEDWHPRGHRVAAELLADFEAVKTGQLQVE